MNIKEKEFAELMADIIQENLQAFIEKFNSNPEPTNDYALLILVKEKMLSGGNFNSEFFYVSKTKNKYLFDRLPENIKTALETKGDDAYFIFLGEKHVTSFRMPKLNKN